MQIQFLLGRAGSGKTWRCLEEIRKVLKDAPDGSDLVFLAPKQATFQLEQQLLATGDLAGFTRLKVLSFERLAGSILEQDGAEKKAFVSMEGRFMILRSVVESHRQQLKIFHSTARLSGFLRELNTLIGEAQVQGLTPVALQAAAQNFSGDIVLREKLHDFALLFQAYNNRLQLHQVIDLGDMLTLAAGVCRSNAEIAFGGLWVDGFAEITPQELDFLQAVSSRSEAITVAFCVDPKLLEHGQDGSGFWGGTIQAFRKVLLALSAIPSVSISTVALSGDGLRYRNRRLRHLEKYWDSPREWIPPVVTGKGGQLEFFLGLEADGKSEKQPEQEMDGQGVEIYSCVNPEGEVTLAARKICDFVRAGGRYRQSAVLVRGLGRYLPWIQPVFERYQIPFFLDRRDSISHHPLVEVTRCLLRLAAFGFRHEDWFSALKTGLVAVEQAAVDTLENEALLYGWTPDQWRNGLRVPSQEAPCHEVLRKTLIRPFTHFIGNVEQSPGGLTGARMKVLLEEFWLELGMEERIQELDEKLVGATGGASAVETGNQEVWERIREWAGEIEQAFGSEALALAEWVEVLESGLEELTVGNVPPSLDQVLVGAVDRSRNPELEMSVVLGLNEGVFPAPLRPSFLLSDVEVMELEREGVNLGNSWDRWIGREQFLAYIALTRASSGLVAAYSQADDSRKSLNPSYLIESLRRLFPAVEVRDFEPQSQEMDFTHSSELRPRLMRAYQKLGVASDHEVVPAFDEFRTRAARIVSWNKPPRLGAGLVQAALGKTLHTSVSKLEHFASCPFKFYASSILRVEARREQEYGFKEQGIYQHELLSGFHLHVKASDKTWREIKPGEVHEILDKIAREMDGRYRSDGIESTHAARFNRAMLLESVERFLVKSLEFFPRYSFDVSGVELRFGKDGPIPPWQIAIDEERSLSFSGVVDRIDLFKSSGGDSTLVLVVDYKSSQKVLEDILMQNGIQLQLPIYLAMAAELIGRSEDLKPGRLIPVGMFYASLRTSRTSVPDREESAGSDPSKIELRGRFSKKYLEALDSEANSDKGKSSLFKFGINIDGTISRRSFECLGQDELEKLLSAVTNGAREMGRRIFAGEIALDPYEKKTMRACDQCDYAAVCGIEPMTHSFRILHRGNFEAAAPSPGSLEEATQC